MNRIKALATFLTARWQTLPSAVQATITSAAASLVTTIAHAIHTGGCHTLHCIEGYAWTAAATAGTTIWAFYMTPNKKAGNGKQ
jgi:hypothetical protein